MGIAFSPLNGWIYATFSCILFPVNDISRYTGCPKKNCAVGVSVTEETIFVKILQ